MVRGATCQNPPLVRTLELALAAACLVGVVWPALFGVRSRRGLVAAGLLGFVAVQWIAEGYRWQLLALYVVAVGMAAGDIVSVERELPWFRRVGRGVFGSVGLGLVVAPALLLPVPELPIPSGPLAIGTKSVTVTREAADGEIGSTGFRTFGVQVWYPAESVEGSPVPWEPEIDVVGPALARSHGLPAFFFGQARYTASHGYSEAVPAEGVYPLLVYSHGWGEFKTAAIDQIEALVSQGYVVMAPDHAGGAVATVVDGEAIEMDTAYLDPPEATARQRVEAQAAVIATFADDIAAILDEVEAGADGVFSGTTESIDFDSVGIWGHGFGGGAALSVCLVDDRCGAVAGLDPAVEMLPDPVLANTATVPMLLMRSDAWRDTENDAVLDGIVARSETLTYWVGVLGADTSDFLSAPLISPVGDRLGLKGPIDGDRVVMINHRYLTGFFDRFLAGTGPAALDTARYSEVDVAVIDKRRSS